MAEEQTLAFLSSIFALLGALMLVLPAFKADRYLSSAQLAKSVEKKIKALAGDNPDAGSLGQDNPRQLKLGQVNPSYGGLEQGNLGDALGELSDELNNNARQWTPAMSWMLRGGILFTLLGGILRIWVTWPVHG